MNLKIYDNLRRPPATALKRIEAGRMKGKSDINPQWRIEAMTREFGACGIGWKYEISRKWTEPGTDGIVFAFVDVNVFIKTDVWSEPIPGTGGSMLIAKESGGLYHNDEAFKMATTDALSVALKFLGVAADIYAGLWDGEKYKEISKPGQLPELVPDIPAWANVKQYLDQGGDLSEVKKKYFISTENLKKLGK
jgi:hypothetical protein